jgi:hypothetical protein
VRIKEGITELNQDAVTERLSNGSFITGVAKPMALSGTGNFGNAHCRAPYVQIVARGPDDFEHDHCVHHCSRDYPSGLDRRIRCGARVRVPATSLPTG